MSDPELAAADPELAVALAQGRALGAEVGRLLDRPEVQYLLGRRRDGLLTADEEAQLAELARTVAMFTAAKALVSTWAIGMRDADESRRPFLVRVVRRVERRVRGAFRRT